MRRYGVFIVNFEHISHISSVSIVNFEQETPNWIHNISRHTWFAVPVTIISSSTTTICKLLLLSRLDYPPKNLKKQRTFRLYRD